MHLENDGGEKGREGRLAGVAKKVWEDDINSDLLMAPALQKDKWLLWYHLAHKIITYPTTH